MRLDDEFLTFLREYRVLGLALGVVIGTATKDLVNAAVDDLIMPIVGLVLPGGDWQAVTTTVGPVTFRTGHFISVALNFLIIAFLLFAIIRYVMRRESVEKL